MSFLKKVSSSILGKGFSAVVGLVFLLYVQRNFCIQNGYENGAWGRFSLFQAVVLFFSILGRLGLDSLSINMINEDNPSSRSKAVLTMGKPFRCTT